ncbi:putative lipoprotein [Shigella sonnei]|nr:putative lipoprotein [Shigella sonnei]
MKRNLLSSAIIVAIMALGLTGCDDKKAETETPPPANSQPAAPAPEAPVAKAEAKPETPAQPVVDEQAVFDEKMDVYIKCYNKLQIPVQNSLARYADWLKDFKQGPTGLKNLESFEPVAESYHAAIQEINDKRQLAELKNIEEREGKTFHYYSLAVMISAKQINNLISQEKFGDAANLLI